MVNIIGCAGHTASVTTTPLCHYRAKAAIDNKTMNECGCVPIKLYLMTLSFEFHVGNLHVSQNFFLLGFFQSLKKKNKQLHLAHESESVSHCSPPGCSVHGIL